MPRDKCLLIRLPSLKSYQRSQRKSVPELWSCKQLDNIPEHCLGAKGIYIPEFKDKVQNTDKCKTIMVWDIKEEGGAIGIPGGRWAKGVCTRGRDQ